MMQKYKNEILPLEQSSHGLYVGLPILIFSNIMLAYMSLSSVNWNILTMIFFAFFPGSVFSLWQLQILHDALHGCLLPKPKSKSLHDAAPPTILEKMETKISRHRKRLHQFILFWGSMPSAFGYYLYLQYGHLTHHRNVGDPETVSLAKVFESSEKNFEDGDVLFVAHRMKLLGETGPRFQLKWPPNFVSRILSSKAQNDQTGALGSTTKEIQSTKEITMSVSKSGFSMWKEGHALRNAVAFASSFLLERVLLIWNDFVVALMGKNFFFPNKPKEFHDECATYCRCAVAIRLGLCALVKSFKPLLFLYLAETLWSIPPHPACAMFITNHGSKESQDHDDDGVGTTSCEPSSSTYAGKWYSIFTLGTNYHVEHHDFPTIPLHKLKMLHRIAPEMYKASSKKDNLFKIMKRTFKTPEFYACMDAKLLA